jgi:fatty acid-binding protein DegV
MVQAGLTGLLNIKPLVELRDGVVSTIARVRTWSRAVDALARFVRNIGPLEHLAVMHSNCVECAHDVMGRVRSLALHPDRSLITSVTTVIGTHVGPHAVGVAAIAAGRSRPSG